MARPKTVASGRPANAAAVNTCDLCGTSEAMVRCLLCSNQTFCLACDDMYHRHPKRCKHARKAIGSAAAAAAATNCLQGPVRPPLPPKGDVFGAPGPVAPPRRNAAGSTLNLSSGLGGRREPALNVAGQSATLPRKPSAMAPQNPASGRPLPPTPTGSASRLAAQISASWQNVSLSAAQQRPTLGRSVSLAYPAAASGAPASERKMSTASQPPMHTNYTNGFDNTGGRTQRDVGHFGAPPSAASAQRQTPPSYPPKPAHVSERETGAIFCARFNARLE